LTAFVFLLAVFVLLNEREPTAVVWELTVPRREIEQLHDELAEKSEHEPESKLMDLD
jgi:hypothetical protein